MRILEDIIRRERDYGAYAETLKSGFYVRPKPIVISGLSAGAANAFYAATVTDAVAAGAEATVFIVADDAEARKLTAYLSNSGKRAFYYPVRELVFHNITASHDSEHERLSVLSSVIEGEVDAVVTTPDAALSYTIAPDDLKERTLTLSVGDEVSRDDLAQRLASAGYVRVDMVDGVGHFSLRGDIVDVYPASRTAAVPYRIEFFGDEIDRICVFDPSTQRATDSLGTVSFLPVREFYADSDVRERIAKAAKKLIDKAKTENARDILRTERECAETGLPMHFADKYLALFSDRRYCLLDYFVSRVAVVTIESNNVNKRLEGFFAIHDEDVKTMLTEGMISADLADYTCREDSLEAFCAENVHVIVNTFSSAGLSGRSLGGIYGFSSRRGVSYDGNIGLLREDIITFMRGNYRIAVLCASEASAALTVTALTDEGLPAVKAEDVKADDMKPGITYVLWGDDAEGFELPAQRFAFLSFTSERDTTPKKRRIIKDKRKETSTQKLLSYNDLKTGDYVVHAAYGIGQYMGLENLTIDGVARDYVKIKYAGTDLLYLPTDQLEFVSKYIGAHSDDGALKLSKMGGTDWVRAKSRAKAAAKDMAKELIALYAARKQAKGYAFSEDDDYQRSFEESFDYEETEAQITAINDIKADMESAWPMDRLLCGDVGYGKTEVALRAAFKAIVDGKQVAFLVPTTILAFQHFNTACARMRPYPVTVEMLSRFRTKEQQAEILRRLRRGEIDMIIGTHRIISKDIKFRDLGLLIIDEEQRFGVAQKEKLKEMAVGVDILTLTATPIPRTLNMAMNGIKDMSILDEAPGNRLPVQTYVLEHDDIVIEEAIRRELRRGGQVFYLYNRVETIHLTAARLQKQFPDARIVTAHGQMDKERLEEIWQALVDGEIDILVCTTIIETGVDVPNANTLVIEDADRLGLAQLHQIRGRVGRSGRRAYAYFTYRRGKALSEISMKRLDAIREYTEFGAGFRVALRDMEIRGAGNLLGAQQHGHLDAVGYDLYVKILENAVLEEKGLPVPPPPPECTVDIKIDAYLPNTYVHSASHRMEMYKKIARIETKEDVNDIFDELCDRFGDMPAPVENLLKIARIRGLGRSIGITAVEERDGVLNIKPSEMDFTVWAGLDEVCRSNGARMRVVSATVPYLTLTLKPSSKPAAVALAVLEKYAELKSGDAK